MSSDIVIGLVGFVATAAAFAAFWHRAWRLGRLPTIIAALCSTAVIFAMDYVETGKLTAYAVSIAGVFFVLAWLVGTAVEIAARRARERASASPANRVATEGAAGIGRRSTFNFLLATLTVAAMQFYFYGEHTGNYIPLAVVAPVYVGLMVLLLKRFRH